MTRQEWFNEQTKTVQKQFIKNCDTLNFIPFYEAWINNDSGIVNGIGGAFAWGNSKQGFEYWDKINTKYLKDLQTKHE